MTDKYFIDWMRHRTRNGECAVCGIKELHQAYSVCTPHWYLWTAESHPDRAMRYSDWVMRHRVALLVKQLTVAGL